MIYYSVQYSRKNSLCVIHFQQSWFSLGAALESIMLNAKNYRSIEFATLIDGLILYPHKLHHLVSLRGFNESQPENLVKDFLTENLKNYGGSFFHYSRPFLPIEYLPNYKIKIDNLTSNTTLKEFKYKKMAVGMAVFSHLVTISKSSMPNTVIYKRVVRAAFETCFQIIAYLDYYAKSFDEFWIWNGRTLHERVVVEWCKNNNKRIKFLEVESSKSDKQDRWSILSESPHSRLGFQSLITNYWSKNRLPKSELNQWYLDRRDKKNNPFISRQTEGKLISSNSNYFVFFTSSDDEVTAISKEWESKWLSQVNAVEQLCRIFEDELIKIGDPRLIVRVHPNVMNKSLSTQLMWLKFSLQAKKTYSNSTVVLPKAPIDSYTLMDGAIGILVYGSTMGLEASFNGKYLSSLAPLRYGELCKVKYLQDEKSVLTWIKNALNGVEVFPSKEGSLAWANWALNYGNKWKYVNKIDGKFLINVGRMVSLKPNFFIILLTRFHLFISQKLVLRKWELFKYLFSNFRIMFEYLIFGFVLYLFRFFYKPK